MNSFFSNQITQYFISRLNELQESTMPKWGKMNAAQMLAHCCVVTLEVLGEGKVEMVDLDEKTRKQLLFEIIKDDEPMAKGIEADEGSVINDLRDFKTEKSNLLSIFTELNTRNKSEFDGRTHPFFGSMTGDEWFVLTRKHLDHHFRQFGI